MDQNLNTIEKTILRGRYSLLFVMILIVYFWYPALFEGKTIIHGDSITHGLPLFHAHIKSIYGGESILWSNNIFGGHPLFAEGQGGYANPLNILIATLFNPILGHQLVHISGIMIAALGVFFLAQQLKLSYWSATFAALAASFSSIWIAGLHNYTVSATMAWIPWIMVAAEYWIKHPSCVSAIMLAIPTSISVLAGYLPLPYGAVIYIIVSLCTIPLSPSARANVKNNWKKHLWSGSLAILLFVGLTAVQVFPLTELIGQSHRIEGIVLAETGLPSLSWVKGLLFTHIYNPYDINHEPIALVPSIGSLMIVGLAIGSAFIKLPNRIFGHLIATLLLCNLGMQDSSPVFNFIYKFHLIPGLHYHRHMLFFLGVAVIGFSLLAAFFIDASSKRIIQFTGKRKIRKTDAIILLGGLSFVLMFVVVRIFDKHFSIIQIVTFIISFFFILIFRKKGFARFIPVALTIVLFSECLLLRSHVFHFAPLPPIINSIPKEIQSIQKDPLIHEYKTYDSSLATLWCFLDPKHPALELATGRLTNAMSGFYGLLFGLPSLDGSLALQMDRRAILDPVLNEEIFTIHKSKFKMIDILSVKYISTSQSINNPSLELLSFNKVHDIWIYKNKNVQPRFQIYCHAEFVNTYKDVLQKLKNANRRTLFLEHPQNKRIELAEPEKNTENTTCKNFLEKEVLGNIRFIEKSGQKYELEIETAQSVWLFLADANYPGWEAKINDSPSTVYSAQVLGKAIKVNPGKNHIIIEYIPRMFYIGLVITSLTILFILGILIWHRRNFSLYRKQTQENIDVKEAT